jgi:hypothetical protein
MIPANEKLMEITGTRLKFQRNYEPKIRNLVETRTRQLEFSESERNAALKSIDALMWKLTAAGIHLERLWEYRESEAMKRLLENAGKYNFEPKRFTDREIAYLAAEFEAYLIQARAFINVAQIHTLDACRVEFGGRLTNAKYEKAVKNARLEVSDRLGGAYEYFTDEVFGNGKWGTLLKSLRDRVVHFDRIRPSVSNNAESEQLCVAGLTLERLAQDFENGHYDLFVEVIAPIWERKWIAGANISGMWDQQIAT